MRTNHRAPVGPCNSGSASRTVLGTSARVACSSSNASSERSSRSRELPDRLEHPVALVGEAERLRPRATATCRGRRRRPPQRLRACSRRRRPPGARRAASHVTKKVVRPLDRRSQRQLAWIGIATSLQQIETLRETIKDLLGRQNTCPSCGQLDSEWQRVETAVQLGDFLARAWCARSQNRETASGSASGGTAYSTSPWMRRSSRLVTRRVTLGQAVRICKSSGLPRSPARSCRAGAAARARRCARRGRLGAEGLGNRLRDERRISERCQPNPEDARLVPARASMQPRWRAVSCRCHRAR